MSWPEQINDGADGYSTMRLESYDLSVDQWHRLFEKTGRVEVARSVGPKGHVSTRKYVASGFHQSFVTDCGKGIMWMEHDSAAEAIAYHEELARDITERIALMNSQEVKPLAGGAL